jgi:hypothetical protein
MQQINAGSHPRIEAITKRLILKDYFAKLVKNGIDITEIIYPK